MNWLMLIFALQLGYSPHDEFVMYRPPPLALTVEQMYSVDLSAEVLFWRTVFIGGSIKSYEWFDTLSGWTFFPNRAAYTFTVGARFEGLEFGWLHYCTHPVIICFPVLEPKVEWEGAYDEFYVKLQGEVGF